MIENLIYVNPFYLMIADNEERYSYLLRFQMLLDIRSLVSMAKAIVEPMYLERTK